MRLSLLLVLLTALPAWAQAPPPAAAELAAMDPDAVLAGLWAEALGGATAVSWALGGAAYEDSTGAALPEPERLANVRRELMTAVTAASAASAHLSDALQFSLALADTSDRAEVYAALADDTVALHGLLVQTAEEAGDAVRAPSSAALDAGGGRAAWRPRSAQVRTLVGRLEGATAALGLVAPTSP
jgi:hypothetical protein